jgi:VWFA-related protein
MRLDERRRILLTMLPLLLRSSLRSAQRSPRFSVTVREVNLIATVRDDQGRYVTNLGKNDFVLREDGRLQSITYFSAEPRLPLSLGLLVDTSISQRKVIADERKAGVRLLTLVLRQDSDKAFVVGFGRNVKLLQHLTSARKLLISAVNSSVASGAQPRSAQGGEQVEEGECICSTGDEMTKLHDAIWLSAGQLMRPQRPRKVLIVLSDGVDRGSGVPLSDAIAAAQKADVAVYAIQFFDDKIYQRDATVFGRMGKREQNGLVRRPSASELLEDGRATLKRIAEETGGTFFQVSGKDTAEKISGVIQEELRNSYSIGYSSDRPTTDQRYRRIALDTKHKGLIVRTRDGYYPAL